MEELLEHKCESFKDKIEEKEYTLYEVDDSNFHPQQVLDQFEESARKIGEHFSDWSQTLIIVFIAQLYTI